MSVSSGAFVPMSAHSTSRIPSRTTCSSASWQQVSIFAAPRIPRASKMRGLYPSTRRSCIGTSKRASTRGARVSRILHRQAQEAGRLPRGEAGREAGTRALHLDGVLDGARPARCSPHRAVAPALPEEDAQWPAQEQSAAIAKRVAEANEKEQETRNVRARLEAVRSKRDDTVVRAPPHLSRNSLGQAIQIQRM